MFMKPLKYDARSAAAYPNALLLDCESGPDPLHVVSAFVDAKDKALKLRVRAPGPPQWVWDTETEVPVLPARSRNRVCGSPRQAIGPGA
jgi:hypothetical protein